MPEQVFIDLTPGLTDVPAETWAGIDANQLIDYMITLVPEGTEPDTSSLRALAKQVRTPIPHTNSGWLSPRLIELIKEQREREDSGWYE